jgi:hypothetical protein
MHWPELFELLLPLPPQLNGTVLASEPSSGMVGEPERGSSRALCSSAAVEKEVVVIVACMSATSGWARWSGRRGRDEQKGGDERRTAGKAVLLLGPSGRT